MSAASHSGTWDSCYVASAPTKLAVSLLTFFSADVSVWMWLCDEIAAAYYVTNAALTEWLLNRWVSSYLSLGATRHLEELQFSPLLH